MVYHISEVITFLKDVVCWIQENLYLIPNLDLKTDYCKIHLQIKNLANFFEFKAHKCFLFKWYPIQLIFGSVQVVVVPFLHDSCIFCHC